MGKSVKVLVVFYVLATLFFSWGWSSSRLHFFPYGLFEPIYQEIYAFFNESNHRTLIEIIKYDHQERKSQHEFSGFRIRDNSFRDEGYLLLSRYSKEAGQTLVELISLCDGRVLYSWTPNLDEIFNRAPSFTTGVNTRAAFRSQHPFLMENGDLVITSGEGPLIRIDRRGHPVWVVERHFHHSIERDEDGNFIVPVVVSEGLNDMGVQMRDDGFAVVSPEGQILEEYSLYKLLMTKDYQGLIYGVGYYEEDRFHLNDVKPLSGKPGEYLLSIRNFSAIARVDVKAGIVDWLKVGPWLNQHDVNMLENGWISVFGNDVIRGPAKLMAKGHSEVYLYHPSSGSIKTPFSGILKTIGMYTKSEGRAKILENGDVFIEETDRDRILRVSPDRVRWEYVNGVTDSTTGAIHWSRYLSANEVPQSLLK